MQARFTGVSVLPVRVHALPDNKIWAISQDVARGSSDRRRWHDRGERSSEEEQAEVAS